MGMLYCFQTKFAMICYDSDKLVFYGGVSMMQVVVCDDNIEDLAQIERMLEKYREVNHAKTFEIERFMDSEKLYQSIQENMRWDIYILDMMMSNKSGIDIGTLIRSLDKKSVIIYITSSDDFALEAYSVHAVRYLLKPVREELFFEALDYALSHTTNEKKVTSYLVKTKDGLAAVPYSKIEYIENHSRKLNVCLTDKKRIQSIFIRKSFDEEIHELAENENFLQVHKSFLVNMNCINKLSHENILMESGTIVPISKTRKAKVKKTYFDFISKHY